MLHYSDFIVGMWFIPVLLCIITPLIILVLWSIKRILGDIHATVQRLEGAVAHRHDRASSTAHPQATA